jgi:hypothetical protein
MLRDLATLAFAEGRQSFLLWIRYPMQSISGLILLIAMFGAYLLGIQNFAHEKVLDGGDPRLIVLTFMCWLVGMAAAGAAATEIEEESKLGQLEALFTSKLTPAAIVLTRSFAGSISGMFSTLALLTFTGFLSGANIALGWSLVGALLVLDIALTGVGICMAGVAILFKRTSGLLSLCYLLFGIGLAMAVGLEPRPELHWWPLISAVELFCRAALGQDASLQQWAIASAMALLSLLAGKTAFEYCVKAGRRGGSLAHV